MVDMDEEHNNYICDFEDEYTDKDKRQASRFAKLIYKVSCISTFVLTFFIISWSIIELYRE